MSKKIIGHGIRWVNNDCGLYCLECHSANITWKISSRQLSRNNIKAWIAECICKLCACKWEVTREETIIEN